MRKKRKKRQPPPSKMPRRAPQKKQPAIQLVSDALELPKGIAAGVRIELSANREAVVEGSCTILEYDENCVKVATGKLAVTFFGAGLTLRTLSEESVIIDGKISSIEFEETGPKKRS